MTTHELSEEEYSELVQLKSAAFKQSIQPILDKLPALSEKAQKRLLMELEYSTQLQGGQFVPIKDGEPILDDHGWPVPLADHAEALARELAEISQPDNTAPPAPRNGEELFYAMRACETNEERRKVYLAYKKG